MQARVSQVIVLSHSKPFLCQLWEGADAADRQAITIRRDAIGSTFALWDVNQDCITEHDRRHALVAAYLQVADPATERHVAAALRHILEAFMRVAYPATFAPGLLLGPFLGIRLMGTDHSSASQLQVASVLTPNEVACFVV